MLSKKYINTNNMICNNIYLRKLKLTDLKNLHYNCSSDKDVAKYCTWNISKNIEYTRVVLKKWINKYKEPYSFIWGIESIKDNQLIGTISVVEKDLKNDVCEIGYAIGKNWWRKGFTSESLKYVLNYLFYFVGFKQIVCKAYSNNIGSIKVMEKVGMKYKNTEKNHNNLSILVYYINKDSFEKFNCNYYSNIEPSFFNIINFYKNQYKNYNPKIDNINNNLLKIINTKINNNSIKEYNALLTYRKKILINNINNVIDYFKVLKNQKLTIYLNGSYSRNSQRIYSDIDLNFMYANKNINKNLPIEDIICFFLTNIFNIQYRDKVHPMGYLKLINNHILNNSNYFATVFNSGDMIINMCRKNCYDIMYENINMPRSPKSIIDYIEKNNDINSINEYVYNHEIIYNNVNKDYIINKLIKTDKKIINNPLFNYHLYQLINELENNIYNYKKIILLNVIYIKDFKKIYKTIPLEILYNCFALLRRINMYYQNNVEIDLIKIDFNLLKNLKFTKKEITKIKNDYYNYIFELNKIEHIFIISGLYLSSHTNEKIDIIQDNYKTIYKENLEKKLIIELNVLYNDMLLIIKKMKEGINNEQ